MTSPDRRQLWGAASAFLLGLLVVLLVVAVIQTWVLADDIRGSQKTNQSVLQYVQDCTTPGGDCYSRSEERYATAVSGINAGTLRIIAAALACEADGITERAELAECTTKRAAKASEN